MTQHIIDTDELKPCPFCGEKPEIESLGTCIDITCCVSMSLQKSDVLTIEQRETFNMETCVFSDEAEAIALKSITHDWNTRANSPQADGMVLVPIEPTKAMIDAVLDAEHEWSNNYAPSRTDRAGVYKAMLSAYKPQADYVRSPNTVTISSDEWEAVKKDAERYRFLHENVAPVLSVKVNNDEIQNFNMKWQIKTYLMAVSCVNETVPFDESIDDAIQALQSSQPQKG